MRLTGREKEELNAAVWESFTPVLDTWAEAITRKAGR
jgi:hypothetical protein